MEETINLSILRRRFEQSRITLQLKAKEYASADDHLHNFDVAARILDVTPEQALQGMLTKHIVPVRDLIDWAGKEPERISQGLIDEKIGDTINYLILLEALLLRRIK